MNHFCTISSVSHLYKTYALAESLKQGSEFVLNVLVIDGVVDSAVPNCKFWSFKDIEVEKTATEIIAKYQQQRNELRWSLKSVWMKYLLKQPGINKLVYLDNDLFFYSDHSFLFDLLDQNSMLLTPHYYSTDPNTRQNWFEANFRVGLFNAGFVGANQSAIDTLQWWAESCLYQCKKSAFRGLFDDQKYLDLVPVINPGAHIVRHKGCNVAGWNKELCPRMVLNGKVMIEDKYPVVFVHYNDTTIREIVYGRDKALEAYYQTYLDTLKKYKPDFVAGSLLVKEALIDKLKLSVWKVLTKMGI